MVELLRSALFFSAARRPNEARDAAFARFKTFILRFAAAPVADISGAPPRLRRNESPTKHA